MRADICQAVSVQYSTPTTGIRCADQERWIYRRVAQSVRIFGAYSSGSGAISDGRPDERSPRCGDKTVGFDQIREAIAEV